MHESQRIFITFTGEYNIRLEVANFSNAYINLRTYIYVANNRFFKKYLSSLVMSLKLLCPSVAHNKMVKFG